MMKGNHACFHPFLVLWESLSDMRETSKMAFLTSITETNNEKPLFYLLGTSHYIQQNGQRKYTGASPISGPSMGYPYGSMRQWKYQQHLFPLRLQMLLVSDKQVWYGCLQVATGRLNLTLPVLCTVLMTVRGSSQKIQFLHLPPSFSESSLLDMGDNKWAWPYLALSRKEKKWKQRFMDISSGKRLGSPTCIRF